MNYIKIDKCDLNNGDGARVTLWVSGCEFKCKFCHNKEAWNFKLGKQFTEQDLNLLIKYLSDPFISGLSILGGEPLHNKNIDKILEICDAVKSVLPHKDIWIWTGYKIENLPNIPNCDYIIDGLFEHDKPTTKKWRGSDNQRMFKIVNKTYIKID